MTTRGDALGDLIERRSAGRGVPQRDPAAFASAVETLLDDRDGYRQAKDNLRPLRDELAWPRVIEPLRRLLRERGAPAPKPVVRAGLETIALSYELRGARGMIRRQAGKLRRL